MASEQRIVGATIAGKYRIRRVVGGGSMGVVCEAEHLDIGKRVAIKLIDASLAGMKDVALRFRQEARAASLIESHHIVQVFDVGSDPTLGLYLVMEYLIGEDLATRLQRDKRLPVDVAVRIAVQVARGLAKAHEAGVVHRDLKPANIFLCASEDDQPLAKILDFGISKLAASSRAAGGHPLKLTRDGMVVGTPQYMSPEQAQGYAVDQRTDLWALGLVLYEMLAGRPAYPELPSYERFIIHLVSAPPEPLRGVAPWVSEELASVVHAALEHDLSKRLATCGEFVKRLAEAWPSHSGPVSVPQSSRRPPPGEPTVDTLVMTDRPMFVGAPAAAAAPAIAREEVPERASPLRSSGVRGAVRDGAPAVEDHEQDAPQFFDRKLLQSLGPVSGSGDARPSVVPPPVASPVSAANAMSSPVGSSAAGADGGVDPRRTPTVTGPAPWKRFAVVVVAGVIGLAAAAAWLWR